MAVLHRHNIQFIVNTHHPTVDNEAGILPSCTHEAPLKPLPAPHTTKTDEAYQDRHPDRMNAKGVTGVCLIGKAYHIVYNCDDTASKIHSAYR